METSESSLWTVDHIINNNDGLDCLKKISNLSENVKIKGSKVPNVFKRSVSVVAMLWAG
jgi:hypothetical protein